MCLYSIISSGRKTSFARFPFKAQSSSAGIDSSLIRLTKTIIVVNYFDIKAVLLEININVHPSKPSRCIKASFYIPENRPNFSTTKSFRTKISTKLVYQYIAIFFNISTTSNHLHPLQVENCDSNSRLVVGEDDNGKFRLERVKYQYLQMFGPN